MPDELPDLAPSNSPSNRSSSDPDSNQRPISIISPDNPNRTFDVLFPTAPIDTNDPDGLGRIAQMALLRRRPNHGGICHNMLLQNRYFSANLPIWIDEFSYF